MLLLRYRKIELITTYGSTSDDESKTETTYGSELPNTKYKNNSENTKISIPNSEKVATTIGSQLHAVIEPSSSVYSKSYATDFNQNTFPNDLHENSNNKITDIGNERNKGTHGQRSNMVRSIF